MRGIDKGGNQSEEQKQLWATQAKDEMVFYLREPKREALSKILKDIWRLGCESEGV